MKWLSLMLLLLNLVVFGIIRLSVPARDDGGWRSREYRADKVKLLTAGEAPAPAKTAPDAAAAAAPATPTVAPPAQPSAPGPTVAPNTAPTTAAPAAPPAMAPAAPAAAKSITPSASAGDAALPGRIGPRGAAGGPYA